MMGCGRTFSKSDHTGTKTPAKEYRPMSPSQPSRLRSLEEVDPEIARAIENEAVLQAMGSVMTNKYAEGLPGKRYYGGCEFVDVAEQLAIERAKKLFNAEHAN